MDNQKWTIQRKLAPLGTEHTGRRQTTQKHKQCVLDTTMRK